MGQRFARPECTEPTTKWHLFMDYGCAFFRHCPCLGRWCTRFSTRRRRSLSDILIDDTSAFRRSSVRRQEDDPQAFDRDNLGTTLDQREKDNRPCCCSCGCARRGRGPFLNDTGPYRKSGKENKRSTGSGSSGRAVDSHDVPLLQSNASQCGRSSVRLLTPESVTTPSETIRDKTFSGRPLRGSSVHICDPSDATPLTPPERGTLAGRVTYSDQTCGEAKTQRPSRRASEHSTLSRESSSESYESSPTRATSQSGDLDECAEGHSIRLTTTPGRRNQRLMSFYDEDGGWWTRPSLTLCEVKEIPDRSSGLSHVTPRTQFFSLTRTDTVSSRMTAADNDLYHQGPAIKGKSTAFENCRQSAQSSKGGACIFNEIISRRSSW
eukprot:GEMP01042221.1.p1 GENE.GEMP01042221.1~~GEMP01042221.1.p1  ORF type:complete len:390 (+),score=47.95 GEMP01042221.1:33-1172(+)